MKIIDITEENKSDYEGLLDEECLNSIGREYYRGIAGKDEETDDLNAAMIWEIKGFEDEKRDNGSEIQLYMASEEDFGSELLAAYNERTGSDEVVNSFFEFSELKSTESSSLINDGFEVKDGESRDVIVSIEELSYLPFIQKQPPSYVKSIADITARQFKAGLMASVLHGRFGLQEDLPYLPKTWFDQDISSCVITDDKINGMLLVHRMASGFLRVELLFAMQPDANVNLLNMMRYSARAAVEICDKNDLVIFRRHNQVSKELVKKLFPDKKGSQVVKGEKS